MAETLNDVIDQVAVPMAQEIDRTGDFPQKTIDALRTVGVLGLTVPNEFGGNGKGMREAASVVRRLANACGSTAMIISMHYSATAVLIACGRTTELAEIAQGRHLTTLAFSEIGSRSHFWTPLSTATSKDDQVCLDAEKSWITSAAYASTYVWSSKPLKADGPMSLWCVRSATPGLSVGGPFDGLGLRGNGSVPVTAKNARVPVDAALGEDGKGLQLALEVALPWFLVLNAAASVGLMEAVTSEAAAHLQRTKLQHLGTSLADNPGARAILARMRIDTDRTRALLDDTIQAITDNRDDATLQVLEIKAAAGDAAAAVADMAMEVCGGAAFRKDLGIERRFRDSRAARVMAPTSAALLDFVGRILCGLPLFDGPQSK